MNAYPMTTIPATTTEKNAASSLGFMTLLSIMIDGRDMAVTPIMNAMIVPAPTPLARRASAMGMVPKMSA